MRVLVVGPQGPDSFADNLASCLAAEGHEVRGAETWSKSSSRWVPPVSGSRPLPGLGPLEIHALAELERRPAVAARLQSGIVEAAEQLVPELTIAVDARVAAPVVGRVRAASGGAPVVLWYTDSLRQLRRESHLLAGYDAYFVADAALQARYRDLRGLNAHLLPEACNPITHRPPEGHAPGDAGPAVLMLGSVYCSRLLLLQRLLDVGIELELRGGHASRLLPRDSPVARTRRGGELVRDQKARAFRRAAVVLNDLNSAECTHLNCRLFEAAASGGAVVTEWRDGLPELFEPGTEVLAYRTFDELTDHIAGLIGDPGVARELGDAAAARARAEHTYAHRFATMLGHLGRG